MIIQLTQGKVAIVDDEDAELLGGYTWHTRKTRHTLYAVTTVRKSNGLKTTLQMHRLILGVDDPDIEVDHVNNDGLDNRKTNLRGCSRTQNQQNRRLSPVSSTGLKGVSWNVKSGKYVARIRVEGALKELGYFNSKVEAHEEYCKAASLYFREFANFG